jgi:hypothetical protein
MSSFAVVKHLDVINGRTSASQADDLAPAGTEVIGSSENRHSPSGLEGPLVADPGLWGGFERPPAIEGPRSTLFLSVAT